MTFPDGAGRKFTIIGPTPSGKPALVANDVADNLTAATRAGNEIGEAGSGISTLPLGGIMAANRYNFVAERGISGRRLQWISGRMEICAFIAVVSDLGRHQHGRQHRSLPARPDWPSRDISLGLNQRAVTNG